MTFVKSPRGSHGQKLPPGTAAVIKWINPLMTERARRSRVGRLLGINVLVLTTIGAKTGLPRKTVLGYVPDGEGRWLIVATAGGVAYNPAWYHNLAAHPDQLEIELGGRTIPVTAMQLYEAEREVAWQQAITAIPRFARFARWTDREIPVIRLSTL
jgi:deazaflavin-dependent oxidoreductase (nitroreductase family)